MYLVSECIYENSEILRVSLIKVLSSLNVITNDLIFINILYSDESHVPYSGMKYIIERRCEVKDNSPVIFYGFEGLASLKTKQEASILNSPGVEYIRLPFSIDELSIMIKRLTSNDNVKDGLDEQTKKQTTSKKLRIFKHDILNVLNTIQIAYKLKRRGTEDVQRRNWDSVRTSFFKEKEKISEIMAKFDSNNHFQELLSRNDAIKIGKILQTSAGKYKTLIKSLDINSKNNRGAIISSAEAIEGLLNEILMMLREINL